MKHTPKTLKQLNKISPEQNKILRFVGSRLQAAKVPTPKIEEYKAALIRVWMYSRKPTVCDTASLPSGSFVFGETYQGFDYWESLMQDLGEW